MKLQILNTLGTFSPHDTLLFDQAVKIRKVLKGEKILNLNAVCQSAYYVKSGSIIQYNCKNEIDQNIVDLHIKNEWAINQQSFLSQEPSVYIMEAYTDCELIELDIHGIHNLIEKSPAFLQVGKILQPSTAKINFFDLSLSPIEKYKFLIENNPKLFQEFPLKIIASYLKMTPETLSRVREKLANGIS